MKQIGNFYVLENREELCNRDVYLKNKITIHLTVTPNPGKARCGDEGMQKYCQDQNNKLKALGLLSDDVLSQFNDCDNYVYVFTEFADMETAKTVFERACQSEIVDIYLEQDCKHVLKYD